MIEKRSGFTLDLAHFAENFLLNAATPDALARIWKSKLADEAEDLRDIYFNAQHHSSLKLFLGNYFVEKNVSEYIQVRPIGVQYIFVNLDPQGTESFVSIKR